jgi:hypothetical protein
VIETARVKLSADGLHSIQCEAMQARCLLHKMLFAA